MPRHERQLFHCQLRVLQQFLKALRYDKVPKPCLSVFIVQLLFHHFTLIHLEWFPFLFPRSNGPHITSSSSPPPVPVQSSQVSKKTSDCILWFITYVRFKHQYRSPGLSLLSWCCCSEPGLHLVVGPSFRLIHIQSSVHRKKSIISCYPLFHEGKESKSLSFSFSL